MATAQGIIREGGSPVSKCFYTAYYKSNNGGSEGPGAGQRASQWMRVTTITEGTGLYSVALSSDNFLGAAATVSNGDQLLVIAWRDSSFTPPENPGEIFYNQDGSNGQGGDHALGFKYDNGDAAVANYHDMDQMVTKLFTLSGQTWNATPGGVGGDEDGDLVLGTNVGPTAALNGLSTDQNNPTLVTRDQAVALTNTSADYQTGQLYAWNGQIVLQQSSAAHRPDGGTQTDDGSDVDGTVYTFATGEIYGNDFGTPSGGDVSGPTYVEYEGPSFPSHSHAFPAIDRYAIQLTVKDDNSVPLSANETYYVQTQWKNVSLGFGPRQYVTWDQFVVDPTDANANWSAANPNTINDVVKVTASNSNPDGIVGRVDAPARGGVYTQLGSIIALDGSAAYDIQLPSISDNLPASAPFGFLHLVTQGGGDIRHIYEITAVDTGTDTITIDTAGSTESYATRDWYFIASEPGGGTDLTFNWEYQEDGSWQTLGIAPQTLSAGLSTGTVVTLPGIAQDVIPGWWFRVIDGPARGYYRIASVNNDNEFVLTGAGLTAAPQAGDTVEVTCRDNTAFWPQRMRGNLDFRISGTYTRGWPSSGNYTYETPIGPVTNGGNVSNIDPESLVDTTPTPGVSTTYVFDGRRSYGTQTTWDQDTVFAGAHTLDGSASFTLSDANIDTTNLRDGHAWIALTNADGHIIEVFSIIDLDRETPDTSVITIDTHGSTTAISAGDRFRTTNNYEIEGPNDDNDISSYEWRLRSSDSAQVLPTSPAEFESRFDRDDGAGSGETWNFTYAEVDDGRYACIELKTTDPAGGVHYEWQMFDIVVTPVVGGGAGRRRLEWD
jgi:hypothetical protein